MLQVVEPHLNGPGGEVPVIGFDAADGEVFVLDGQGPAPAAATLEAFGALGLDLVPGTGLLAACVPAAFGTWMLLLERHGRLRLRDVMEYAIGYAGDGYPMLATASAAIAAVADTFREHWPSSAEVYLPGGTAPAPGARFANPDLAAAYTRILDEAEAASARPRGPDRGRPAGVLRGVRGRGHRRLPGAGRGDGRHRAAPPGPADRVRPGRLASVGGGPGHRRTTTA